MSIDQNPEFVHRVLNRDTSLCEFCIYTRLVREKLGWTREVLSIKTGLSRDFLAFLENKMLLPGELTEDIKSKIEGEFPITFYEFKRVNSHIWDLIIEMEIDED